MDLLSRVIGLLGLLSMVSVVSGIGANWGTQTTHPLPPETVVKLLRENGIQKVKLFDVDYGTLNALAKSGIKVMVGIPNDMLSSLASSVKASERWVSKNVSTHITSNNVNIKYVAVGNEPFLETYNGSYLRTTYPALQNIQSALIKAGLSNQVKVTVSQNADVYESSTGLPSGGDFRTDIHDLMLTIVIHSLEFYHTEIVKLNYERTPLRLGSRMGKIVFDSGSFYTYLPKETYTQLIASVEQVSEAGLYQNTSDETLPICWRGGFPIRIIVDNILQKKEMYA
ncbi:hypothetical protein K2173_021522 [Erythroxylum novogranatense]|uniref:glucan endo-1,3-beta-D-glucosidase n=1 Tax=Erythroxylum novogranatense TaxID=1862640 RepID=A0AAV8TQE8_9ROSI|nr:hypothetical protein K2173_021522 [Erythroxylum novogranatense]